MRLTFQLRFHTHPGESIWIVGNHEILGNDDDRAAIRLDYMSERFWRVTLTLEGNNVRDLEIRYRYLWRKADGTSTEDSALGRGIKPAAFKAEEMLVLDAWNHPGFYENAFYTEPFRDVLLKPKQTEVQPAKQTGFTHVFRVRAPLLEKDQTLCLLGNRAALGNWDTASPILMGRSADQEWLSVELDLTSEPFPVEYKYGVYDLTAKRFLQYEGGPNRLLEDRVAPRKQTILNDGFVILPSTNWKGAGVAIPVFSLRSRSSFGVGEFTDLKLLADWCHAVGIKLIQILPVNDTTVTHTSADSYPYAAISAFALHPLYLNLSAVASKSNQNLVRAHELERTRLNALPDVDYQGVMDRKLAIAKQLFRAQKDKTFATPEYQRFLETNRHWLEPYAVFCYLRDQNGTADFNRWQSERRSDKEDLLKLGAEGSPGREAIELNYFLQYNLHVQLKEASEYAHRKGVILKGDIAIGVSRFSADAWQEPELYRMDMQAGAPPDAFGIKGQNWSFPTYDWDRMKATGFAWWKQRFSQMAHYFDAFRIDHILGFFRIWSVPIDSVEGIMGYFVPAIPVHVTEFGVRGISFDPARYTEPYITDEVLNEVFGPEAADVRTRFLQQGGPGSYALKPEFATQRQVEHYFDQKENSSANTKLREGLYDLISNVILFEEPGSAGERFHFRFSIETTFSFKSLDPKTQDQLRDMYIDYFYRRQDAFWKKEAMQKLPPLKRETWMLICGEDLGMVPACVPEAMKQLGLLSLEVQRMPKALHQEFSHPKDAPYLSVVTPSTHDMSTLRGWWTEDRNVTQRFFNRELGLDGQAPQECEPWLNQAIIAQHLASPAMWSVFQLQDLLGSDARLRRANPAEERINVPADAKNYWKYRMHLFLEDLLQASDFNNQLRRDIQQNHR